MNSNKENPNMAALATVIKAVESHPVVSQPVPSWLPYGREIRKSYFLIPVTVNVVFQSVASLKSVALYGQVPFLVTVAKIIHEEPLRAIELQAC